MSVRRVSQLLNLATSFVAASAVLVTWPSIASADLKDTVAFDIAAQQLPSALNRYSEQAGVQVTSRGELIEGKISTGVSGKLAARDALDMLLKDTDLRYDVIDEKTVVIMPAKVTAADDGNFDSRESRAGHEDPSSLLRLARNDQQEGVAQAERDASGGEQQAAPKGEGEKEEGVQLEEIVVTGTHIRGVPADFSPLTTYDNETIKRMGVTSLDQFISRLTSNVSTLSTNGGAVGAVGSNLVTNNDAINAIDLRGLGVGTTLVLLNGRRIALSNGARTPDVSLIPLSAVDRVEVLTDGASAIYGSDAVAGVVNFILKDRFDGAETTVGFGNVTSGSHEEVRVEQSFGREWNSGRGLLGYSYLDRAQLEASDRSFANVASPYYLIPADRRHNLLATVDQELAPRVDAFVDFLYSKRDTDSRSTRTLFTPDPTGINDLRDTGQDQYFASVGLRMDFTKTLQGELLTSYSRVRTDQTWNSLVADTLTPLSPSVGIDALADTFDVTAKADGDLWALPAGAARFSLGAGYSEDRYTTEVASGGFASRDDLDRRTHYAFVELFVPLVSREQALRGVHRLELSLAARYTDYSDFGNQTSPKIGLLWSPVAGLLIRGTYGESFRAPFLSQMNPNSINGTLLRPADFGIGPWAADEVVLFTDGSNPGLGPEEAQSYTAGFELQPAAMPGLRLSATYFNIDYSERIGNGDPSGGFAALVSPELFPDLFVDDPSTALVTPIVRGSNGGAGPVNGIGTSIDLSDPAQVAAITDVLLDNRLRNLLSSALDGFDLNLDYRFTRGSMAYDIGSQLTRLFDSTQQVSLNAPPITVLDTLLNPIDLRVRSYFGLSMGPFQGQINLNYWDDYSDPYAGRDIDAWTTIDLALSYDLTGRAFFDGTRISASIQNLLDEDPPFVAVAPGTLGLGEPIGYDPTNASPVGRFISVQLSRKW